MAGYCTSMADVFYELMVSEMLPISAVSAKFHSHKCTNVNYPVSNMYCASIQVEYIKMISTHD